MDYPRRGEETLSPRTALLPLSLAGLILSCPAIPVLADTAAQAAPALMLAHSHQGQPVAGWLASEKLDGIRAYWDGKMLYSRGGNPLHPSAAFRAQLPPFPIDGELFLGRGRFQETLSHLRRGDWQSIEFHIFDVPEAAGGLQARLGVLQDWLAAHPQAKLRLIEQIPVRDLAHAQALREQIEAGGGEGLMLRHPEAPYLAGRSALMLKLKSHADAECRVLAHLPGQGKHQGRLGALLCRLDEGGIIRIGSGFSDAERSNPPPIGSRITFRFRGHTADGKPRFATFWRIRED